MITIRPAETRGSANFGWLDSKHSFSFGHYFDPQHMGHGPLRVINEDRVAAGQGFGTHPHRDMEIFTWVLEGELEHKDSMGNGSVIRPGELQRMTAGTGITHSEFNPSSTDPVHLYQIWLFPERKGLEPSYEQKQFPEEQRHNRLRLVASRDARDGSLTVHQDVDLYASVLETGNRVELDGVGDRRIFVQVVAGDIDVNGAQLSAGDGLQLTEADEVVISASSESEFLLFNLA